MAAALADLFANPHVVTSHYASPVDAAVVSAVSSGIEAALLSRTGVAAITNGVQVLVLRVLMIDEDEDDRGGEKGGEEERIEMEKKVTVEVTQLFVMMQDSDKRCNERERGNKWITGNTKRRSRRRMNHTSNQLDGVSNSRNGCVWNDRDELTHSGTHHHVDDINSVSYDSHHYTPTDSSIYYNNNRRRNSSCATTDTTGSTYYTASTVNSNTHRYSRSSMSSWSTNTMSSSLSSSSSSPSKTSSRRKKETVSPVHALAATVRHACSVVASSSPSSFTATQTMKKDYSPEQQTRACFLTVARHAFLVLRDKENMRPVKLGYLSSTASGRANNNTHVSSNNQEDEKQLRQRRRRKPIRDNTQQQPNHVCEMKTTNVTTRSTIPIDVDKVIASHTGILSINPHRTILRSAMLVSGISIPVVVKICNNNNNRFSSSSSQAMISSTCLNTTVRDEIHAYSLLASLSHNTTTQQQRNRNVLDVAVPRLLAWNNQNVAVVQKIGFGLCRVNNMCRWTATTTARQERRKTNGRIVRMCSEKDVDEIRQAACDALSRLHEIGMIHGKVALRHVRVHQQNDGKDCDEGDCLSVWKAWWVDLSRTRFVGGSSGGGGGGHETKKKKRSVCSRQFDDVEEETDKDDDDDDGSSDNENENVDEWAIQRMGSGVTQREMQRARSLFSHDVRIALVCD